MKRVKISLIPALLVETIGQKVKQQLPKDIGTKEAYKESLDILELEQIETEDTKNFFWSDSHQKWKARW
ncbi:MAG: hypothetical protein N4A64_10810 [Marinisporobacter sp.]|jgi:hypothetical protein|nr:hypothetical protein [Marinisporobacter sp.]